MKNVIKHIIAIKNTQGDFEFIASPTPDSYTLQENVQHKKVLHLNHAGEEYRVYCDDNLTDQELQKLKNDWLKIDIDILKINLVTDQTDLK